MDSRASDFVRSYTTLTSSFLERWGALASNAASKVDAGAYDAGSAAEDTVAGAGLAAEAAGLWTTCTYEAFATLLGLESGPNIAESQPFRAPAGAKLELEGPFSKGPGLAQLPARVISIEPAQLGPTETTFTLRADASGYRGGTYVGKVKVTTGAESTAKTVWIIVP